MKFPNVSIANQSSRLAWIDYARAIAIILVVYRHVFEGLSRAELSQDTFSYLDHANIIFYSFRMPLFFILSGAFLAKSMAKKGVRRLIQARFSTLFYPYVLWAFIQISIQLVMNNVVNADRSATDYLYIFSYPRRLDQFWYLLALFNVSVLYILTKAKLHFPLSLQLILGVGMYWYSDYVSVHHIDLGLVYDIFHFYLFFALGDLIGGKLLDEKYTPVYSSWKVFIGLLPFFIAGQYYFLQKNLAMHDNLYIEHHQPLLFAAIALTGCAFVYNVSFILQRYNVAGILRIVGFHSLYIYLLHVLIASATRIFFVKVLGLHSLPWLMVICITTSIVLSITFYRLAMQMGAWWLFSLDRPGEKQVKPAAI
ncbi:acyltransferase family protein [Chitinophaga arvensicola]|uniref:Fucose 4-O-acetylase n=1 Tax=Chitinophaga arvensicola TaxID=29529 RepID=A0A1I0S7H0_9BACT|nr:acyltransferase [Chitinophaga arvensicola]SEW50314.1 Fucose 4-O-acetylase [Chitinophaga arvensicola]